MNDDVSLFEQVKQYAEDEFNRTNVRFGGSYLEGYCDAMGMILTFIMKITDDQNKDI